MGGLGTFLVIVTLVYAALGVLGLAVVPLLSLPRVLLSKYELKKVHDVTDRIDGGLRVRVAGALSHPHCDQGQVSLSDGRSEPTSLRRVE